MNLFYPFTALRSWTICLVLLAMIAGPVAIAQTDSSSFSAPSAVYRSPAETEPADSMSQLKSAADVPALSLSLDPPSAAELAELRNQNPGKNYRVGIGRALPEPWNVGHDFAQLAKTTLSDGGQALQLDVSSPGARALRLQLRYGAVPKGVELRFYNPQAPSEVRGPVSSVQLARHAEDLRRAGELGEGEQALYWSPLVDGEQIAVEIYFPPGVAPERLQLATPMLSHLVASPLRGDLDFGKDERDIGLGGSCNIDVNCSTGLSDVVRDSVGKYIYTTAGGQSGACTGTMMNTDPSSFIPYFLTARHCVSSQFETGSMEMFWFFQRTSCGGGQFSMVQQSGGATLLSTAASNDHTMVELRNSPPNGVGFAGWSAATVNRGAGVVGIHHPRGDLKKISFGEVLGFAPFSTGGSINVPSSIEVQWSSGTTEPGSSGSGLFASTNGGELALVGTLSGGRASCANLSGEDFYGRFDQMFPALQQFLVRSNPNPNPNPNPGDGSTRLLNISTQGFVGSAGMQAGFIVTGSGSKRFVVLAEDTRTGDGLRDPVLRLINLTTGQTIDSNDDWESHPTAGEISASLGRSPVTRLSAGLAVTLPPGVYTALVDGVNGTTGRALIGVQEIQNSVNPRLLNISTQGVCGQCGDAGGFYCDRQRQQAICGVGGRHTHGRRVARSGVTADQPDYRPDDRQQR